MMKQIILLCCGLLLSLELSAQNTPDNLLDISKYLKNQDTPYQSGTFVHIDLPNKVKEIEQFKPIPLQLSADYTITTPFGNKTQAAFVPHTTDFTNIVQILGDGSIVITQTIQFVSTKEKINFSRTFNKTNATFTLLQAIRNGEEISSIKSEQSPKVWRWQDTTSLPSGIHSYTFTYLVKNAFQRTSDNTLRLNLSLTGVDWDLPVERFSCIILIPNATPPLNHALKFGSNNLEINEAFNAVIDNDGNISYSLTHPLPAFADVKLDITFPSNMLTKPTFLEQIEASLSHFLFLLCLLTLLTYTLLTKLYLKYHKTAKIPLNDLSYYSIISLRHMTNHKLSPSFFKILNSYMVHTKKKRGNMKENSIFLKLFIFLNVMRKYLITMGIIIMLTVFQSSNTGFSLNYLEIVLLIITAICLNLWLYKNAEKPYIKKLMNTLMDTLLTTDIGFGLGKNSLKAIFLRYYPYALAMEKQKEWKELICSYNFDITDCEFCQQEGIK